VVAARAVVVQFILAFLFFHLIGLPLLTLGLARARTIPWWLAALATSGSLAAFFGSGTPLESVGWVAQGVGLVGLGWSILRHLDEQSRTAADPHSTRLVRTSHKPNPN
jgi:hypothetical protein